MSKARYTGTAQTLREAIQNAFVEMRNYDKAISECVEFTTTGGEYLDIMERHIKERLAHEFGYLVLTQSDETANALIKIFKNIFEVES